jgi:Bax protein
MRKNEQVSDRSGWYLIVSCFIGLALLFGLVSTNDIYIDNTPLPPLTGLDALGQESLIGEKPKDPLPDFASIQSVAERKKQFFDFVRPLINYVNKIVDMDRSLLMAIRSEFQSQEKLTLLRQQLLELLASRYNLDSADLSTAEIIKELDSRINIIPPALVLAQAANESSWGRSRFAKQGNNLFGQWCFRVGCGIIPANRPSGKKYEVAMFQYPVDSVMSYVLNLNSFSAYKEFRRLRRKQSADGKLTGIYLAQGLINYSTRRQQYVDEIRAMIKQNNLE